MWLTTLLDNGKSLTIPLLSPPDGGLCLFMDVV
jgi:hypothetical protein